MSDTEDKKPEGGAEPITIRVKDQNGEETMFKVKRSTKMAKVFKWVLHAPIGNDADKKIYSAFEYRWGSFLDLWLYMLQKMGSITFVLNCINFTVLT